MTRPSRDHLYLVSKGWRFTGARKMGFKTTKYWEHPDHPAPPCGSYYQTDALMLQRILDGWLLDKRFSPSGA
jgi:hypothetical protein